MSSDNKMKLGYWSIRGLAEPIRALLAYAEVDYEDVIYDCGDAPDFDKTCWTDIKFKLGLEFPNLPYLFDGDVKLTQTIPIMHYLSVKYGIFPKEMAVHAQCDMIDHVAYDLNMIGVRLSYSPADVFKSNKPAAVAASKVIVQQLSGFLGTKTYFAGDYITGTDFWLFEVLDRLERIEPNSIEHDNIKEWRKRIFALPTLQNYFNDPKSTRNLPLNNKMASFK